MLRRKRSSYSGSDYPGLNDATLDRRRLLAGLGAVAGLAATTAVDGGCFLSMAGVAGGELPDDSYRTFLPAVDAYHLLYLGQGHFSYRLTIDVAGATLADWVEANREPLLEEIDGALSAHAIEEFGPDASLAAIESELRQLLADVYAGEDGASVADWYGVEMAIDEYDEEEEMDGMIGDAE